MELMQSDVSPHHRSVAVAGPRFPRTLGCFCSTQLMQIICRDAVEGCHKDLAQGVWENSRGIFHAQTPPALMMSIKYERLPFL